MKRRVPTLRLDFHAHRQRQLFINLAWLALAALLVIAPVLYHAKIQQETAALDMVSIVPPVTTAKPVDRRYRQDGADSLVRRLDAPWEALLNGIEQSATDKAVLLSLQPNLTRGEAVLHGEAARYADVLDYIERLKAQPGFLQAYLTNHTVNEDAPGQPVSFTITVSWRAAS